MPSTPIWVTVLVAIIAAIGPILSVWIQRSKPKEDAAAILVDSATGLSEAMSNRIIKLETRINDLENKLDAKENRITELSDKIEEKETEIEGLESKLRSKDLEINELKRRMTEMEEKLKQYEQDRDIKER